MAAGGADIYQLKITLKGVEPPVWRRLQVSAGIDLRQLHLLLQVVMGWHNEHLYEFRVGRRYFGEPEPKSWAVGGLGRPTLDAGNTRLLEIAPRARSKFLYTYDMGDSWEHQTLVEKVTTPEPGVHYPTCLAGERACPPEDCGGVWGYADILAALRDPDAPESAERLEWLGDVFEPDKFDLAGVNAQLSRWGTPGRTGRSSRR
ncbi:MAG: plasmid pRiA4b ORF-3 family protein [Candidatus Dormibacteraeota bacterium]|nr:plasmid pRiA4b ORF-3 family protein [Candidatus Dormibacteraeota bacterium]